MTPENAASAAAQPAELTPENAELLAEYADSPRALAADRPHPADLPRRGPGLPDVAQQRRGRRRPAERRRGEGLGGPRLPLATSSRWPSGPRRPSTSTSPRCRTSTPGGASASRRASSATRCPGTRRRHWTRGRSCATCAPSRRGRAPVTGRSRCCRCTPEPASPRSTPWTSPTCACSARKGERAPRRQGREVPHRARPRQAPRGAGRVARRAALQARRRLGRPVHLGPAAPG